MESHLLGPLETLQMHWTYNGKQTLKALLPMWYWSPYSYRYILSESELSAYILLEIFALISNSFSIYIDILYVQEVFSVIATRYIIMNKNSWTYSIKYVNLEFAWLPADLAFHTSIRAHQQICPTNPCMSFKIIFPGAKLLYELASPTHSHTLFIFA